MKTITLYDLLGLVKDGKAPKKIKYMGYIFEYDTNHKRYESYFDEQIWTLNDFVNVDDNLNDTVKIPNDEEEKKKIPEKLEEFGIQYNLDYIDYKNIETLKKWLNKDFQTIYDTLDLIIKNQNQLIDFLKSKGE